MAPWSFPDTPCPNALVFLLGLWLCGVGGACQRSGWAAEVLSHFLAALSREADSGGTEYTGTFVYCEGG